MLELGGRVGGAGWGDDAGQAVDGLGEGDVVDLCRPSACAHVPVRTR